MLTGVGEGRGDAELLRPLKLLDNLACRGVGELIAALKLPSRLQMMTV